MQLKNLKVVVMLAVLCVDTGCGISVNGPPPGAFLGRAGTYNYSPSAIQVGNVQQFWWCGQGHNPNLPSQNTDTIQYVQIDLSTQQMSVPMTVLAETPGTWDSEYTCNPKVVMGSFNNPLGDGQNYSYAMYYVGTASPLGLINSIGVAFSNDGIHWKKYPQPVISENTQNYYGVAQPAPYNSDHKAGIWLFYEDSNAPPLNQHVKAVSIDGIHFTVVGKLTANGLPPEASWGDIAYDPITGYWYATFNGPFRASNYLGNWYETNLGPFGASEPGQFGVSLYRIKDASLLTGISPWEMLKSFDTNLTGFETNFIAGLLRDQYGNVNVGPYPKIQLFPSISDPQPSWNASKKGDFESSLTRYWNIGKLEWVPGSSLMPLNQYKNQIAHEVTTGWTDPNGGFALESTVGHLYENPQHGANLPLYGCKTDDADYFVSTDNACGGNYVLGLEGYGYSQPEAGIALVPLYSCYTGHDHFVSHDAKCDGHATSQMLGYAVP